jgi:transcriptional regulator with XRE-family HTH domain
MRQDVLLQISNKLREIRKTRNITLQEVADDSSITKSMLSQIENGRTVPSLLVLMRLINALGIDLDSFFKDIDLQAA